MAKRPSVPDDPKRSDSQVRITDFAGIACGLDLHDTDPGETYVQVNVVPFHPGELRVRRGFVLCQFDLGAGATVVAPPQARTAVAQSLLWLHPDAHVGRQLEVAAFGNLVMLGDAERIAVIGIGKTLLVLDSEAQASL